MTLASTQPAGTGEFAARVRRWAGAFPAAARLSFVAFLLLLAVPTGLVALGEGSGGLALPFNLHIVDQRLPGLFKLHMLASGASLVLIPIVLALRRRRAWHRPLGWVTAVLVLLGAVSSFPVAYESSSVLMARLGFAAQGASWLALVAAAVRAARQKRLARHAELMVAMAAVASGAIWVRLTTAAVTSVGLPFDPIYGCAAWAGWLVPWALVTLFPPRFLLSAARAKPSRSPLAVADFLA